jgi:serine/threonine-protein kinase
MRYNIEPSPFAMGGMGEIYKATDRLSGQTVAIKTINKLKLRVDDKTVRNFLKEAEATFRLSRQTPHVVEVIDLGYEDDTYYMALEYVDGGNILDRAGDVTGTEAKQILTNVLTGMKIAHDNKIVHSDISPDNILHDKSKNIYKLSDFGLLKILETKLVTRGQTMFQGGKHLYMHPTHFYNHTLIDFTSDFYALGMVYHLLITGEILYPVPPKPPAVPATLKIKKQNTNLHQHGRTFAHNCMILGYKTVDQVIAAVNQIPNQ